MTPITCEECKHPITFHGSGETRCKATGCSCKKWVGPSLLASKTMSVADAAAAVQESQSFLRLHAEALGGEEIPLTKLGKRGTGTQLRFRLPVLERKLVKLKRKLDAAE